VEKFWNHVREGRISILALQNWTSIRVLESWASDLELGGGGASNAVLESGTSNNWEMDKYC
jgi:hypothetical protein